MALTRAWGRAAARACVSACAVRAAGSPCRGRRRRAGRGARASRAPPRAPRRWPRRAAAAAPPTCMAEQVQRGLRAGRAGGQEQRLVDVLQRGVDLGAALGLVDHPAHLVADDVAGDEDPAGAAHVERAREAWRRRRRTASRPSIGCSSSALACLTPSMSLDLRQLGEQLGRHVGAGAARGCCRAGRLVGGARRPLRSGA